MSFEVTEADHGEAADIMADTGGNPKQTRSRIAHALAAAREQGSKTAMAKVLGTPVYTKDGYLVCQGAKVYHPGAVQPWALTVHDYDTVNVPLKIGPDNFICESEAVDVCECYSTPEAAEAARAQIQN